MAACSSKTDRPRSFSPIRAIRAPSSSSIRFFSAHSCALNDRLAIKLEYSLKPDVLCRFSQWLGLTTQNVLNDRLVSSEESALATITAKRQTNRWPALLDAAAAQFAERGYHATSIRDLAAATAMTPGAIYFHVASKQALLLAVYEEGVQRTLDSVETAVAGERDPWMRLEKAVAAHLQSILDASAFARVVIRILPNDAPEISAELTELRDRYEARLQRYFSAVTLPKDRDMTIARLA